MMVMVMVMVMVHVSSGMLDDLWRKQRREEI